MTAFLATLAILAPSIDADRHVSYPGCNSHRCVRRVQRRAHDKTRRRWRRVVRPYDAYLNRIAACESGGRWTINTGNGYAGGLQFSLRSWQAVGGSGWPHQASELEQKYRAVRLSHIQGWSAWPVCAR